MPAKVVDIEGDTISGEVKAGKRTYSDFIKFRDAGGEKMILSPEFYPEVITTEIHFVAIWFDSGVAGYNTYCYGKLLVSGDIQIYDVVYPFRTCACKTQGTRKNNWVVKVEGEPLFIIQHNPFTDDIQNLTDLQRFLRRYSDISKTILNDVVTRRQLLSALKRYNELFRDVNRTYTEDSFDL